MRIWLLALTAVALVVAPAALADLTLHPAGQGPHTYASWKAQEGQADTNGDANQALWLDRGAPDEDAAAVAVVRGLEGEPVSGLVELSFDHRRDGLCTPVDPRWTLFIQGQGGKRQYAVNLGCALGRPSPSAPGWIRRDFTQAFIRAMVLRVGGTDALNGTFTGLAIVVDRSIGYAALDNIAIRAKTVGRQVWTYAGDNGAGGGPSPLGEEQTALLRAPLTDAELTPEDDLLASLTDEEWALVLADADE